MRQRSVLTFVARQMEEMGRTGAPQLLRTMEKASFIVRSSGGVLGTTTTTCSTSDELVLCCAMSKPRISARGADIR